LFNLTQAMASEGCQEHRASLAGVVLWAQTVGFNENACRSSEAAAGQGNRGLY
jgi:hypothetical protein